jgi:acetolactate synthase-1/2/3 large subunit
MEFINRLQIPVVVSLMGKDALPHNHPLFVGFIGSYGNRYANLALANCDLVIALGSRMDSRQTAEPKTFARAAKKIHVDIDPAELNNTVVTDLAIHSHLRGFFEKMLSVAEPQTSERYANWLNYIREVKAEFDIESVGSEENVNPKTFFRQLSDFATGREIFLADVGNHQMWAAQELRIRDGQRFLTSGGLGSMGFAIPASIGAYFACPDRPIVSVVGDGGFQMSIPELETIVHNHIPIKIIVFNNGVLGLMWHFQNENFPSGHPATEDGYRCPDIQKIAAAYGLVSMRLEDNLRVKDGIGWLLSAEGPALLEVVVHRSWAGYPKVKPGNPLEGQMPEISNERLRKYMLIPMVGD